MKCHAKIILVTTKLLKSVQGDQMSSTVQIKKDETNFALDAEFGLNFDHVKWCVIGK
jgi:hypothetical protein